MQNQQVVTEFDPAMTLFIADIPKEVTYKIIFDYYKELLQDSRVIVDLRR